LLVTVEDNVVSGGAGSAVAEFLNARGITVPVLQLGLPDSFPEHGTRDEVLRDAGLDSNSMQATIAARMASQKPRRAARRAPSRQAERLQGAPIGAGSGLSGVLMR
jgi:1-deoxy-D-xylulose-5-phosphate synthase